MLNLCVQDWQFWFIIYLLCVAVFFLTCFDWAKEALQEDLDREHSTKLLADIAFFLVHLIVSLLWPWATFDMVREHLRNPE